MGHSASSVGVCGQYPHARKAEFVQFRRILEHEERGEAGRDLPKIPSGRAHRVRGEAGIEAGPVVELHRGDEDEVGLAAERLDHATDARRAQAGRPGDEGQVLRRVAALELGHGLRAAVGAAVEGKERGHRDLRSFVAVDGLPAGT